MSEYAAPQEVTNSHANCDVDQGPEAFHHSLGTGADQAAAGNHSHAVRLVSALPAAGTLYHGRTYVLFGGAGIADLYYICLKSVTDTYSWKLVATG